MIHIEKLMGAKSKEIRSQLFLDAALTVLFAFLLSLLLINDMLPWFNNLLSTRLSFSFFFSRQVLPLLLILHFPHAVIPGLYISHKLSQQTLSKYRQAYTGKKKQQIYMVACYHPVYIFNRVSVCNHSCTKTNGFNQIPCIPLRKYNRNREWHPSSVSALSGTETNGWNRVYKSFHEFCTLLLAS